MPRRSNVLAVKTSRIALGAGWPDKGDDATLAHPNADAHQLAIGHQLPHLGCTAEAAQVTAEHHLIFRAATERRKHSRAARDLLRCLPMEGAIALCQPFSQAIINFTNSEVFSTSPCLVQPLPHFSLERLQQAWTPAGGFASQLDLLKEQVSFAGGHHQSLTGRHSHHFPWLAWGPR